MMRRLVVAVALLMAVVTASACIPRRAEAVDNLVYIIPAAVGGVVIVVLIVAILMADRSDDGELSFVQERRFLEPAMPASAVRLAPHCPPGPAGVALICW